MKLIVFLLFSILLPFVEPCSATRPLREIALEALISNFAVSISEEKLLQKIQELSDDYEAKIVKNLQRLSVALMRDLLDLLQKDALSFEAILTKINTGGYQNASGQEDQKDVYCFHHLSRYSFDEISKKLHEQPKDASEQNFRHLSATTVKVFLEAKLLFNEYVQACAKIFDITDGIGTIVSNGIRSFYNLKKSEVLYNELPDDPWYHAAAASNGSWSTVVHLVLIPHTVQFDPKRAEDFIHSVTEKFNKYIESSMVYDENLKQSIKQQFRNNCIEYLLRGVYTYYETPFSERDKLVSDIFEYALKTSDDSALQPSK